MVITGNDFREALGLFATGVAVVTAQGPAGGLQGMTVSSFNSVSLTPPLVLFSVARNVVSFPGWQAAKGWGISVLRECQAGLSARFARSGPDKWLGVEPVIGSTGLPLIPDALAHFECERYALYDGGDHVIFVGRVLALALNRPGGSPARPLIFFSGRYHQIERPHHEAGAPERQLAADEKSLLTSAT
jgi:flavin reductase (DIM6/NTAB) family NADH-FMN oxidoreductase RutF